MSFGVSVSDIVLLIQLTGRACTNWNNACSNYAEITGQLDSLHIILNRLQKERKAPESLLGPAGADYGSLVRILQNSKATVTQLNNIIVKSKSLGRSRKRNWDRVRLANQDLGALRSKLNLHISTLTAYLETIGVSALGRIENDIGGLLELRKAVDKIASEFRAGRREGSVVSTMTEYEGDNPRVWRDLRSELNKEGFSSASIEKCKSQLKRYVRYLHKEGLLEEDAPPLTTYSDDEIAFRDQLSPALPYPVLEVGGANEPIEATGSPADGVFVGAGLGHDTARGEVGHYIEPSLSSITNHESHTPGINRGQGLWAEGGRQPCLVEVSNEGKDPTRSWDVENGVGNSENSGAKAQAKDEGQNAAENGGVDRWDELEFLERYVGDGRWLELQELIHAIRSANSSMGGTGEQDGFKRAEEGIDDCQRPDGMSPRGNYSQILRRESLEQPREPKTRHYTDSGCTDTLNLGSLTDMPTERCGLGTLKDDNIPFVSRRANAKAPSHHRSQDTITELDLSQSSAKDRESTSSPSDTVLENLIRRHRPAASELDANPLGGHLSACCLFSLKEETVASPLHDTDCVCKAGVTPVGWSCLDFDGDGITLYEDELAEYEELATFCLPPITEECPNSPLPPGWTRVESTSGRISWRHESGILSFDHPGYSEHIAFGCEEHASCMRIHTHPFNFAAKGVLERRWVYIWDAFSEDSVFEGYVPILCLSNIACQMTPESWVKRPRPVATSEKGAASTTAEPLRGWFQVHTLEGRITFVKSFEGDDVAFTYVDPRWSSQSKTAMDSGSAKILYEWEYELPRGWEQHHNQEGKIYFTKSEDGLLTETWIDPRWQDSWDKFQRAR